MLRRLHASAAARIRPEAAVAGRARDGSRRANALAAGFTPTLRAVRLHTIQNCLDIRKAA